MSQDANHRLLAFLRNHQAEMVAHLTRLVTMESPTDDKEAVDRLGGVLAGELRDLGATVDVIGQEAAGNHLRARWGSQPGGALVLCHMDTVWSIGTLARMPVRVDGSRLYGPGAFDMKGGIVNGMWAIRALRELDLIDDRRITLLITSDEETGSDTSRAVIETEAVTHEMALVLEPAHPPRGALKTWRKGTGDYRVTVIGRAAHAGAAHDEGINAIEELAHQVLAIQALTDYAAGTTINVGVISGGTRSNVVPERAWVHVDMRVMNAAEEARIDVALRGLRPRLAGAAIAVSGGMNRPPMVRTPATAALFRRAAALAADLGFRVEETGTGGGSDGNFTSALGVPTLDGLGVVGDGGHAAHEHVIIESLPERAALLAALLREDIGRLD